MFPSAHWDVGEGKQNTPPKSSKLPVGSKKEKSNSGSGSIHVTNVSFKLAFFLCLSFLCLSAQDKIFPRMLYTQPPLNPASWGSPTHRTRWAQCGDHLHGSVAGTAWSAVAIRGNNHYISSNILYCVFNTTAITIIQLSQVDVVEKHLQLLED